MAIAARSFSFRGRLYRSGESLDDIPEEQLSNLRRTGHAVDAPDESDHQSGAAADPNPKPKRKR